MAQPQGEAGQTPSGARSGRFLLLLPGRDREAGELLARLLGLPLIPSFAPSSARRRFFPLRSQGGEPEFEATPSSSNFMHGDGGNHRPRTANAQGHFGSGMMLNQSVQRQCVRCESRLQRIDWITLRAPAKGSAVSVGGGGGGETLPPELAGGGLTMTGGGGEITGGGGLIAAGAAE